MTAASAPHPPLPVTSVGRRGSNHVGDFTRRQDANLAAVCDVNTAQTERAIQTYYSARNVKPKAYSDLRREGIKEELISLDTQQRGLASMVKYNANVSPQRVAQLAKVNAEIAEKKRAIGEK